MTTRDIIIDLLENSEFDHRFDFLRKIISDGEFKFMPTEGENEVWHLKFMLSNRKKSLEKVGGVIVGVDDLLNYLYSIKNENEVIDSCGFTAGYLIGSVYVRRSSKSIAGYTCVDTKGRSIPAG